MIADKLHTVLTAYIYIYLYRKFGITKSKAISTHFYDEDQHDEDQHYEDQHNEDQLDSWD